MDREAAGIGALVLAFCVLAWFFEVFVAGVSAAAALCAVFALRGVLSKSQDARLTLTRKLPHVVGGLIVSALVLAGWRWLAVGLTGAATFGYLYLIYSRRVFGAGFLSWVATQFGLIVQSDGVSRYLSSTFYGFAAIALLLLMFYPMPAAGGILVLSLSDSVAAFVGVRGRLRVPRIGKTVEGCAAMFASSLAILLVLGVGVVPSLAAAAAATVVEALPLPVDDNFTIPVVVAVILEALAV